MVKTTRKVHEKSLDESKIIAALLHDALALIGGAFDTRALRLTLLKVGNRTRSEGLGFLTKTLPRLAKRLDQSLGGGMCMNATEVGFKPYPGCKFPKLFGELFIRIFRPDGYVLPDPDANCVKIVREILYSYSKYELPYDEAQEQEVVQAFKRAEDDLAEATPKIQLLASRFADYTTTRRNKAAAYGQDSLSCADGSCPVHLAVVREARILLNRVFQSFDPTDVIPRHGPGVVATKQRLSQKFQWTNVCDRITDLYPFDAYFCASQGHVCDTYNSFDAVSSTDHSARVLLVPKDSRGPRLISCEPVDFQWIQQGLRAAIYRRVETHPLTRFNVFFTNQEPNRFGALLGSRTGGYVTLDLKEASDRVHLDLVRLLFPSKVFPYLEASRSASTVLPSGETLPLRKFAPMGSALCFPIMALTIWAILTAHAPNADTRESILVYGDDVIVPTAYAESAMSILEAFWLKINRAKSCTQGSFRESCGMDAFRGIDVTPVRFRTVWDESPRPDVYESYIAYANSLYDRQFYTTYNLIVEALCRIYGPIPGEDMNLSCPSLRVSPARLSDFKARTNKNLQKRQFKVLVSKSLTVNQTIDGWLMLLRYFSEVQSPPLDCSVMSLDGSWLPSGSYVPFSVSAYTKRDTSILVSRWR